MIQTPSPEITLILQDWNEGSEQAKEKLLPFVYDELRRQARILMARERSNHTLQPTALVHEAFIKLSNQAGVEWKNRSHFFGIAAHLMRQILVDHARVHAAAKRGSNPIRVSIDDLQIEGENRTDSALGLLAIDRVLDRLAAIDPTTRLPTLSPSGR